MHVTNFLSQKQVAAGHLRDTLSTAEWHLPRLVVCKGKAKGFGKTRSNRSNSFCFLNTLLPDIRSAATTSLNSLNMSAEFPSGENIYSATTFYISVFSGQIGTGLEEACVCIVGVKFKTLLILCHWILPSSQWWYLSMLLPFVFSFLPVVLSLKSVWSRLSSE